MCVGYKQEEYHFGTIVIIKWLKCLWNINRNKIEIENRKRKKEKKENIEKRN